jgi:hypothetical protein
MDYNTGETGATGKNKAMPASSDLTQIRFWMTEAQKEAMDQVWKDQDAQSRTDWLLALIAKAVSEHGETWPDDKRPWGGHQPKS